MQSAPFEMVEMERIVGGKTGWGDTRVKRISKMGDANGRLRLRPSEQAMGSSIDTLANLYNIEALY